MLKHLSQMRRNASGDRLRTPVGITPILATTRHLCFGITFGIMALDGACHLCTIHDDESKIPPANDGMKRV